MGPQCVLAGGTGPVVYPGERFPGQGVSKRESCLSEEKK